jgi:uncharacterized integral membrane protein
VARLSSCSTHVNSPPSLSVLFVFVVCAVLSLLVLCLSMGASCRLTLPFFFIISPTLIVFFFLCVCGGVNLASLSFFSLFF